MNVVYLLIKCNIELNRLDEGLLLVEKHSELTPEDLQLKLAKLKILRLKQTTFEYIF